MKRPVELYSKKVLVLKSNTPAYEAARTMSDKCLGSALVSNGKGQIVGIVTDRDLACGILGERMDPSTAISEVMAADLKFIFEGDSLLSALKIMQRFGVRRVPVLRVNKSGSQRCMGIYTLDDFMLWGDVDLSDLRPIVKKQVRPVRRSRYFNVENKIQRKEQTLNHFNKTILAEIGFERELGEKIIFFLTKSFVQRVPPFVAKSFIAGLPSLLQEDFLSIKTCAVENRGFGAIERELSDRYGVKKGKLKQIMPDFWRGLKKLVPKGVIEELFENLPNDIQSALAPRLREVRRIDQSRSNEFNILL